jgi:hypothetical protein
MLQPSCKPSLPAITASHHTALQAIFVVHKTRSAVLLADMEAPSTVTLRLVSYTPSELHMRQLKSSTIGACRQLHVLMMVRVCLPWQSGVSAPNHAFLLGSSRQSRARWHHSLCTAPGSTLIVTCCIQCMCRQHVPCAGKLATLRGTVTRLSHVRPLMTDMAFICSKCGCSQKVELPDGRFAPPTRCGGEQRTHARSMLWSPPHDRCWAWQRACNRDNTGPAHTACTVLRTTSELCAGTFAYLVNSVYVVSCAFAVCISCVRNKHMQARAARAAPSHQTPPARAA